MSPHDWQPDGGVLRFEVHPGGEAAHVHTTCAKCGARTWFIQHQWELLAKGCTINLEPTVLEQLDVAAHAIADRETPHP